MRVTNAVKTGRALSMLMMGFVVAMAGRCDSARIEVSEGWNKNEAAVTSPDARPRPGTLLMPRPRRAPPTDGGTDVDTPPRTPPEREVAYKLRPMPNVSRVAHGLRKAVGHLIFGRGRARGRAKLVGGPTLEPPTSGFLSWAAYRKRVRNLGFRRLRSAVVLDLRVAGDFAGNKRKGFELNLYVDPGGVAMASFDHGVKPLDANLEPLPVGHQSPAYGRRGWRLKALKGALAKLRGVAGPLAKLLVGAGCETLPLLPDSAIDRLLPKPRRASIRKHRHVQRRRWKQICRELRQARQGSLRLGLIGFRFVAGGKKRETAGLIDALLSTPGRLSFGNPFRVPLRELHPAAQDYRVKACGDFHAVGWDEVVGPDGMLTCQGREGNFVFRLEGVGSFLKRGAKEVLLYEDASDDHSHAEGYALAVVIRRTGKEYKVVKTFKTGHDDFRVLTTLRMKNGRDLAVLSVMSTHHGKEHGSVYASDLLRPFAKHPDSLPIWDDSGGTTAVMESRWSSCKPVKATRRDLNGDGRPDLVIIEFTNIVQHPPSKPGGAEGKLTRHKRKARFAFDGRRLKLIGGKMCRLK